MKEHAKTALKWRTTKNAKKENTIAMLTSYCVTVRNLLKTYATDDIIAAVENDLLKVSQLGKMSEE